MFDKHGRKRITLESLIKLEINGRRISTGRLAEKSGEVKESIVDGVTGILIDDTDEKTIKSAIIRFNKIRWNKSDLQNNAKRFSKERFVKEMRKFVSSIMN